MRIPLAVVPPSGMVWSPDRKRSEKQELYVFTERVRNTASASPPLRRKAPPGEVARQKQPGDAEQNHQRYRRGGCCVLRWWNSQACVSLHNPGIILITRNLPVHYRPAHLFLAFLPVWGCHFFWLIHLGIDLIPGLICWYSFFFVFFVL